MVVFGTFIHVKPIGFQKQGKYSGQTNYLPIFQEINETTKN